MIQKERFKLLFPVNLLHTMAHIYPYLLTTLSFIIREDISMDYTQAGILSMSTIMVTIPFTIFFGFVGDRICNWRLELIAIGYLIVAAHPFIIYAAYNYTILIIAAVVGGIGASIFHPIALPLLSQEFGVERNVAHSFNLIFGTFGSIITPITSIGLAELLGWRQTCLIFAIVGLCLFPLLLGLLFIGKKELKYCPLPNTLLSNHNVKEGTQLTTKDKLKIRLAFITAPFIALVFAQVVRSGIFRIMNTFTTFIFEDEFGSSEFAAAGIMSIVLGCGGIAALISGFISRKRGSLRIFLWSVIATIIAGTIVSVFVGLFKYNNWQATLPMLILAVLFFVFLSTSFYFGSPSSNALFAEMVPDNVLSSTYGIANALMTGFSALAPVIFGAIHDRQFAFPFEYFLLILFAVIPFLSLLYVKAKIGFKTPDEAEDGRQMIVPACKEGLR